MAILLLAARSSLADHYYVPTGSMEYTILPGDRVFIDKTAYGLRIPFTDVTVLAESLPERGDVAVFDSPADGTRLIKRVAAVAGDTVEIHNGLIQVNGELLATAPSETDGPASVVEVFDSHRAILNLNAGGGPPIEENTIPAGFVLAIGDHRGNSLDSRYFGLIEAAAVYGRAVAVYYRREDGFTWRRL